MKHWFKLMLCSLLTTWMVVGSLAGCQEETEVETSEQVEDCGEGEAILVESDSYCVYEQSVVVENGFLCPGFVSTLTRFGPIGVCSAGTLSPDRLVRVAGEHRRRKSEDWEGTDCIEDEECDSGQSCSDEALCVAGEVSCPEGTERVDGPEGCLQDDATCEEISPGVWCTGPDSEPLVCPEGFDPVEVCAEDAECVEVGTGEARLLCQRVEEEAPCCCEFIAEGDIIIEDLLVPSECRGAQGGQCIEVDPNRLTPHPCCPDAQGERCGD